MLRSINEIRNYALLAKDGEIGKAKDFLFDDEHWTVRFMVASTGKWLTGKKVLISPISFGETDWKARQISVNLTREQIEEAPLLEEHAPVSRRHEARFYVHHGWPYYWAGPGAWGPVMVPSLLAQHVPPDVGTPYASAEEEAEDKHLRSVREVINYDIEATDGRLGHVEDFIVDDRNWVLRYLVIDTKKWLPGRQIVISPAWVDRVSWGGQKVSVGLTREQIRKSPEYDPSMPVNREYEERLYDFYGRPFYWK